MWRSTHTHQKSNSRFAHEVIEKTEWCANGYVLVCHENYSHRNRIVFHRLVMNVTMSLCIGHIGRFAWKYVYCQQSLWVPRIIHEPQMKWNENCHCQSTAAVVLFCNEMCASIQTVVPHNMAHTCYECVGYAPNFARDRTDDSQQYIWWIKCYSQIEQPNCSIQ